MPVTRRQLPLLLCVLLSACDRHRAESAASTPIAADHPRPPIRVIVDPHTTRSIAGHSKLERGRYFSICDSGRKFERRVGDESRYDYLVNELGISFGRDLGLVNGLSKNPSLLREDPARPGYSDLEHLKKHLVSRVEDPSPRMLADFGPKLDVALHGQHAAYPEFMGIHLSEWLKKEEDGSMAKDHLPANVDAAAELAATVLRYGYSDFTRPRFYEPVNEPHWSYFTMGDHLAKWHLAAMERVHAETPGVLVGGPCMSVGYFYSQGYRGFMGMRNFIDATGGRLDFYSFHVYDFYREWHGDEFSGAILSGLPLEGVLDLVPNYTSIRFGVETPIVVSETGGYSPGDRDTGRKTHIEEVAAKIFPGEGFAREMRVRSMHDVLQLNSTIASTLAFLDHPHTVRKAVPFMLLETSAWNPRYYATLYARKDFDRKSKEWVPSTLHHFYQLFRGVQGRRVLVDCPDPDIQTRAFVDGQRLFIITHNLANKPEHLAFTAPAPKSVVVRRLGRTGDLRSCLGEEPGHSLDSVSIGGRETLVLVADYGAPVEEQQRISETIHYGDAVTVPVKEAANIRIPVPDAGELAYATLRIGYNRPGGSSPELVASLNGTPLHVPVEDSAPRYDHGKHGYSTTKLIRVDPALVKLGNTVTISFPDGGEGTIGSAVLRVGRSDP